MTSSDVTTRRSPSASMYWKHTRDPTRRDGERLDAIQRHAVADLFSIRFEVDEALARADAAKAGFDISCIDEARFLCTDEARSCEASAAGS